MRGVLFRRRPLLSHILGNLTELLQGRLQVFDDLCCENVGVGQIGRVFQRFIPQPEDVEIDLVACQQFIICEGPPAAIEFVLRPRGDALMSILRIEARHKFIKVSTCKRILFQCKVDIGAQIVNSQRLRPRRFAGRLAIEEQHVGLDALRVKDAGGHAGTVPQAAPLVTGHSGWSGHRN